MNTPSATLLSRFAKAPLFAGLALVLGSSLSWSDPVDASAAPIAGIGAPGVRSGLNLG
jgi:hypothetical protein